MAGYSENKETSSRTTPGEKGDPLKLHVDIKREFRHEVVIHPGILESYGGILGSALGVKRVFVITDKRVNSLYGQRLAESLEASGLESDFLVVDEGEESKSLETYVSLLERLSELKCARRDLILNFGGGVITDVGGFVASTYMRGIPYANFATSLLAQLDAGTGGKVAVNTRRAKNLLGAFYHPVHVGCDPELLKTLSWRDYKSGIAEGIKVAMISKRDFFPFLEKSVERIRKRDTRTVSEMVFHALRIKLDELLGDPFEKDLRRALNLGHTLGHPIETEFEYRGIRHGEAVAVGLGVAAIIGWQKGFLDLESKNRILDLLEAYDLLWREEKIPMDKVVERMKFVKLIRGNHLYFVLPSAIGEVIITDKVSDKDIVNGFEEYEEETERRSSK